MADPTYLDQLSQRTPLTSDLFVSTRGTGIGSEGVSPLSAMLALMDTGASFNALSATHRVFVDKSGNDTTGTGSLASPYLTVEKALDAITDNSGTNLYIIDIGSGTYNETNIKLKIGVWLRGAGRSATRLNVTNDVTLDPNFNSLGNGRCGIQHIHFTGSTSLIADIAALAGSATVGIALFETRWYGSMIYTAKGSGDFVESWHTDVFTDYVANGGAHYVKDLYCEGGVSWLATSAADVGAIVNQLEVHGNTTIASYYDTGAQAGIYNGIIFSSLQILRTGSGSVAVSVDSDTVFSSLDQNPVQGASLTRASILGAAGINAADINWQVCTTGFTKTLAAHTTFTFSGSQDGDTILVALTNTASNYTVTWPAGIKWVGGSAPTQTVGAKTDIYIFRKLGSIIYGQAIQNLF